MSEKLVQLLARIDTPVNVPRVAANEDQLGYIVGGVLIIAGIVSVVFIIIGGFKYIISQGDASNIKQAKDTIIYSVFGLVFVALAFFIVQLVLGVFE